MTKTIYIAIDYDDSDNLEWLKENTIWSFDERANARVVEPSKLVGYFLKFKNIERISVVEYITIPQFVESLERAESIAKGLFEQREVSTEIIPLFAGPKLDDDKALWKLKYESLFRGSLSTEASLKAMEGERNHLFAALEALLKETKHLVRFHDQLRPSDINKAQNLITQIEEGQTL